MDIHRLLKNIIFPSSIFVRKNERYDPDLLGEREFGITLHMICKINEPKQTAVQWEFCFHAANSFVKIIVAMSTWMTCMVSH
jgi:hypothetical protein